MLTKEDLKAIEKLLSPRFDMLDKRMDKLEDSMDKLEASMDKLEERMEKIYVELDRRICSIVDTVSEMRDMLESSTFVSVNNRGDIKRQDNSIQEIYKMNIEVDDRLNAIEEHLNAKYDPLSRSLRDKSKIDYELKRLKG